MRPSFLYNVDTQHDTQNDTKWTSPYSVIYFKHDVICRGRMIA